MKQLDMQLWDEKTWKNVGRIIDMLTIEELSQKREIRCISQSKTRANDIKWHQEGGFCFSIKKASLTIACSIVQRPVWETPSTFFRNFPKVDG